MNKTQQGAKQSDIRGMVNSGSLGTLADRAASEGGLYNEVYQRFCQIRTHERENNVHTDIPTKLKKAYALVFKENP